MIFTSINSSSLLRPIAISPDLLIFLNSSRLVFLTIPFLVANNRYNSSSLLLSTDIRVVIFSFGANCNKFTIAVPFAFLFPSGISNASNLNTLPLFVKNNNLL